MSLDYIFIGLKLTDGSSMSSTVVVSAGSGSVTSSLLGLDREETAGDFSFCDGTLLFKDFTTLLYHGRSIEIHLIKFLLFIASQLG